MKNLIYFLSVSFLYSASVLCAPPPHKVIDEIQKGDILALRSVFSKNSVPKEEKKKVASRLVDIQTNVKLLKQSLDPKHSSKTLTKLGYIEKDLEGTDWKYINDLLSEKKSQDPHKIIESVKKGEIPALRSVFLRNSAPEKEKEDAALRLLAIKSSLGSLPIDPKRPSKTLKKLGHIKSDLRDIDWGYVNSLLQKKGNQVISKSENDSLVPENELTNLIGQYEPKIPLKNGVYDEDQVNKVITEMMDVISKKGRDRLNAGARLMQYFRDKVDEQRKKQK